jgi:uncharacterized protein
MAFISFWAIRRMPLRGELRMIGLAPEGNRLYYVAFVDRGPVRWVISLRHAERREVKHYVQNYP